MRKLVLRYQCVVAATLHSMDIHMIRRRNLNLLLAQFKAEKRGLQKDWAAKADMVPDHVTQIKNGHRDMGGDIARRIEKRFNLDVGWMDVHHSSVDSVTVVSSDQDLRVPTYKEFTGQSEADHQNDDDKMETVTRAWLEKNNFHLDALFAKRLDVSNLRPAYLETDFVVINTEFDGSFKDGCVYAFGEIGGTLRYYYTYERAGGGMLLANGSESDRPDEIIEREKLSELKVVGQIVRMTRYM